MSTPFYDLASLVLVPSGYKASKVYAQKPLTTDGQLTFSRASTATRVASNGLIEKVRTNLILQSNTFSTTWAGSGSSVTGGQSGYDGTSNAWLLTRTGASGFLSQNLVQSTPGVVSVYAKANANSWFRIRVSPAASSSAFYNLSNGTLGTVTSGQTATITSIGNGWYRCTLTYPPTSSDVRLYVADADGEISGSSGSVFIQSAQWELGDIATPYIPTTTAAVSVGPVANVPRLDYLNSSCPRLLLEPQRTNLLQFSEQIDNTYWTKQDASITANTSVSPDGYTNADSLIENSATAQHLAMRTGITITNATAYTASVYFKANTRTRAAIQLAGAGFFDTANGLVIFNLSTGAIISQTGNATGSITSVGNGWYRCTATKTSVGTSGVVSFNLVDSSNNISYAGNGTNGVFIWGAQLEAGAYATSYIPTLGSASTRASDACSKTGISSLIGQTEGTIFAEIEMVAGNGQIVILTSAAGNEVNRVQLYIDANRKIGLYRGDASVNIVSANAYAVGTTLKIAGVYKANDYALYVNGVSVGTDTSATAPVTPSVLYLGQYVDGSKTTTISAKQTLLFKTRLTNAQLAELTTL